MSQRKTDPPMAAPVAGVRSRRWWRGAMTPSGKDRIIAGLSGGC
jgi:hypothetical protein